MVDLSQSLINLSPADPYGLPSLDRHLSLQHWQGFSWRLGRFQRRRLGWCGHLSKRKDFVTVLMFWARLQIHGDSVQGRILHGNSPLEFIEHFTEAIGRPPELPEWIISGAVVGMQGGTDLLHDVWDKLQTYDVPISSFWLQDWVGQRKTVIGSQLWWNWEVDTTRYSGWQQLITDLSARHIKVMTYCNPCLAPMDEKPNRRRNLFEEAKKLDILIKDNKGEPYMVPNTAFDVGMLDLTHPHTASWFKQILQEMVDDGVRGWMADFGEGLPVDASLYSGLTFKLLS